MKERIIITENGVLRYTPMIAPATYKAIKKQQKEKKKSIFKILKKIFA